MVDTEATPRAFYAAMVLTVISLTGALFVWLPEIYVLFYMMSSSTKAMSEFRSDPIILAAVISLAVAFGFGLPGVVFAFKAGQLGRIPLVLSFISLGVAFFALWITNGVIDYRTNHSILEFFSAS